MSLTKLENKNEKLNYKVGDFPISEDISSRIMSLPMHPYLSLEEIEQICNLMLEN